MGLNINIFEVKKKVASRLISVSHFDYIFVSGMINIDLMGKIVDVDEFVSK